MYMVFCRCSGARGKSPSAITTDPEPLPLRTAVGTHTLSVLPDLVYDPVAGVVPAVRAVFDYVAFLCRFVRVQFRDSEFRIGGATRHAPDSDRAWCCKDVNQRVEELKI